jgi:hypothetical protein
MATYCDCRRRLKPQSAQPQKQIAIKMPVGMTQTTRTERTMTAMMAELSV